MIQITPERRSNQDLAIALLQGRATLDRGQLGIAVTLLSRLFVLGRYGAFAGDRNPGV